MCSCCVSTFPLIFTPDPESYRLTGLMHSIISLVSPSELPHLLLLHLLSSSQVTFLIIPHVDYRNAMNPCSISFPLSSRYLCRSQGNLPKTHSDNAVLLFTALRCWKKYTPVLQPGLWFPCTSNLCSCCCPVWEEPIKPVLSSSEHTWPFSCSPVLFLLIFLHCSSFWILAPTRDLMLSICSKEWMHQSFLRYLYIYVWWRTTS